MENLTYDSENRLDAEGIFKVLIGGLMKEHMKNQEEDDEEKPLTQKPSKQIVTIETHYLRDTLVFLYRVTRRIIHFLHILLDKYLAILFYHTTRILGDFLFIIQTKLYEYIKNNKYVDDDKFEAKMERDRIVLL